MLKEIYSWPGQQDFWNCSTFAFRRSFIHTLGAEYLGFK
jgi:hypothetical protein